MAVSRRLESFLDQSGIKYVSVVHSPAYTAQEIAASIHQKGRVLAKAVMVKADGDTLMAVLPASHKVDFAKLHDVLEGKDVRLATETEFKGLFPECEVGAMPPFGNLYGLSVLFDASLAEDEEILFNAGTHTEVIRMAYGDVVRLVKPRVASFAKHL
jgi:Ala-tRNA(Pro) deacylase